MTRMLLPEVAKLSLEGASDLPTKWRSGPPRSIFVPTLLIFEPFPGLQPNLALPGGDTGAASEPCRVFLDAVEESKLNRPCRVAEHSVVRIRFLQTLSLDIPATVERYLVEIWEITAQSGSLEQAVQDLLQNPEQASPSGVWNFFALTFMKESCWNELKEGAGRRRSSGSALQRKPQLSSRSTSRRALPKVPYRTGRGGKRSRPYPIWQRWILQEGYPAERYWSEPQIAGQRLSQRKYRRSGLKRLGVIA